MKLIDVLLGGSEITKMINENGQPLSMISPEIFIDALNSSERIWIDMELNKKYGKNYLHILGYWGYCFSTVTSRKIREI